MAQRLPRECQPEPAADTAKAERTAAEKVRAELAKLDSQREKIYSFLEQGVYSAGEFRERMESLEKRRTQLSENLPARLSRQSARQEGQSSALCADNPQCGARDGYLCAVHTGGEKPSA